MKVTVHSINKDMKKWRKPLHKTNEWLRRKEENNEDQKVHMI